MKVDSKVIIAGAAILVVLAIIAVIGAACCACVFFSAWNWNGVVSTQTVHETRTYTAGAADNVELDVNTFNGDIDVMESSTATDITITYDVSAPEGHLADVQTNSASYRPNDHTVVVTAEVKQSLLSLITGSGARVQVLVPKNSSYTLSLRTANGDVTLAPLHGPSALAQTSNGNVHISGGNYDWVRLHSDNGGVRATDSYETTNATLTTSNGNVEVDTLQTAGTLYAETSNGNVRVTLPRDTQFTVDARTSWGNVDHGSIVLTTTTDKRTQLAGYTAGGAGNLTVTLKTSNGNIDIGY